MSDIRADVGRLADAAEKLLAETNRLRSDVQQVGLAVKPIHDSLKAREPWTNSFLLDFTMPPKKPQAEWTVVQALNVISLARDQIENCEHDIRAIRSAIKSIDEDAISREEMKGYLKTK